MWSERKGANDRSPGGVLAISPGGPFPTYPTPSGVPILRQDGNGPGTLLSEDRSGGLRVLW